jgi:hypothetical protein
VVTCWDGSSRPEVNECDARPRGIDGLSWLYPSLELKTCVDEKRAAEMAGRPDPAPLRAEIWRCRSSLDGRPAKIYYYEWYEWAVADREERYAEKFAGGVRREIRDSTGRVWRVVWLNTEPNEDGEYELSSVYSDLPFSMSVYAATYDDLEQVLDDQVVFREPSEMLGAAH